MLSRFCKNLCGNNVPYENGQTISSEECSELDTTSTAVMVFNNGYVLTIMDTSSMMDNTLQVTIQPSTAKHSIYYYFSSTFEVQVTINIYVYMLLCHYQT